MLNGIKKSAQKFLGVLPEQHKPDSGNVNTFANAYFSMLNKATKYPVEAVTAPQLLLELRPAIRKQRTYGTTK